MQRHGARALCAEGPAVARFAACPGGDGHPFDGVAEADELAAGTCHSMLDYGGPARDESRVLGVTRRTSAKCVEKLCERLLAEPEIRERVQFRGGHGSTPPRRRRRGP